MARKIPDTGRFRVFTRNSGFHGKALKWMKEAHPSAFSLYEKALGEFNVERLENWIAYIKNLLNRV